MGKQGISVRTSDRFGGPRRIFGGSNHICARPSGSSFFRSGHNLSSRSRLLCLYTCKGSVIHDLVIMCMPPARPTSCCSRTRQLIWSALPTWRQAKSEVNMHSIHLNLISRSSASTSKTMIDSTQIRKWVGNLGNHMWYFRSLKVDVGLFLSPAG